MVVLSRRSWDANTMYGPCLRSSGGICHLRRYRSAQLIQKTIVSRCRALVIIFHRSSSLFVFLTRLLRQVEASSAHVHATSRNKGQTRRHVPGSFLSCLHYSTRSCVWPNRDLAEYLGMQYLLALRGLAMGAEFVVNLHAWKGRRS